MSTRKPTSPTAAKRILRGSKTVYPDGRIVTPPPLDIEHILAEFERSELDRRSDFLCIIANSLTVDIRALLCVEPPIPEADIDRVKWINEHLHQLTGCINSRRQWSASDMTLLVREIIESSLQHGLDRSIGRALASAAGLIITAQKPVAAK